VTDTRCPSEVWTGLQSRCSTSRIARHVASCRVASCVTRPLSDGVGPRLCDGVVSGVVSWLVCRGACSSLGRRQITPFGVACCSWQPLTVVASSNATASRLNWSVFVLQPLYLAVEKVHVVVDWACAIQVMQWPLIECLHDPANLQQTSSKCIQNTRELLDVCWIV